MNKINSLIAILFSAIPLWASNTITYTATEKLEVCNLLVGQPSFGSTIISHEFTEGVGTIVCDGEITMIGDTVFDECPNLISVNIPNSVKEIGFGTFRYSGLTDVYVNWASEKDLPTMEGEVFTEIASGRGPQGATLHAPEGTYCVYPSVEVWQDFGTIDVSEPTTILMIDTITWENVPYQWSPCQGRTLECWESRIYRDTIRSVAGCDSVIYLLELTITPPIDNKIITYTATEKLTETTDTWSEGFHTNAVNVAITSHEFSNGTGTITFADEVTTIGEYAFYDCSSLTSIAIPKSVTTIGAWAFSRCSGLTSITIPNSVTTIGYGAFDSGLTSINVDAANTHYCSIDGVLFNYAKDTLIQYPIGNKRTKYTIPNSVTTIGNSAFFYCNSLISIDIPNSVTTIGMNAFCFCYAINSVNIGYSVTTIGASAFNGCTGLTSVTIPNSVTTIGESAFYDCTGLTSINVDAANTHYCSIDGVLFNYAKDTLIQYPIGNKRTKYTIPNSVTTIGNSAFFYCCSLISIDIPNSVTTIGTNAFCHCFAINSVNIGYSVTTIGNYAFGNCTNLQSISCEAVIPPETNYAFSGCDYSIPLYVPAGSKEAYQTAPEWRNFTNIYDIISSVDSITTTTAVIKWQKVDSAVTYTLSVIETESADTVAKYEIDSIGNIIKELRLSYAPQRVLDTTVSSAEIFEVSLTNLSSCTTYTYALDAKDSESTIINSSAGTFTTKSETAINVIKEERPAYHRPINILGQPIDPNTHRGIYIQNGKKYLNSW